MDQLLQVHKLQVALKRDGGLLPIVTDMSFSLDRREIVVLLGESGSGKTIMSRALTGLFPASANLTCSGEIRFAGRHIDLHNARDMLLLRRTGIRYIFQDPLAALNPVATVRSQLRNAFDGDAHTEEGMMAILHSVGIRNPGDVLDLYPHQLSIGMAQRVIIALAIQPQPPLLIADEPTSAVDASLRYRLLDLLASLRDSQGTSILLITHDLRIAQRYGTRILVMYKGHLIESADRESFFARPLHPYSQSLLEALPSLARNKLSRTVAETPTVVTAWTGQGCRYAPECLHADEHCASTEPVLETTSDGREIRCHYWK